MKIAPLNVISGYSFLQSGLTIERIISAYKKNDYYGLGLADIGVLFGAPSFVEECKKVNSKWIVGATFKLEDTYSVYAINETGYYNLIKLVELSDDKKLSQVELKKYLEGTVLVLQTNDGFFKENFTSLSQSYLTELANISSLADAFYLGVEVTTKAEFQRANEIRNFAKERSYNTIAFPRILYEKEEDAIILKMVQAIEADTKLEEKEEKGFNYFQTNEAYKKLYTQNEILNTNKVVDLCNYNFSAKRGQMVKFPVEDSIRYLKESVLKGLREKNIADEVHIQRAKYELEVIISMGYQDYFLIVADYVNYAKNKGILVGPGRGSAAGSLVSYSLNITEVDPLKYDLQFERFLNKARKTMPDIDVDFSDLYRDHMVQYMREKYGEERVSSIVTFQTIKAKQALRDVGRIYDIPTHYIDMLSKSITDKVSLREAYKTLPSFRYYVDSDKYFLDIVSHASKIENLPRQNGVHAAGVVINDTPIKDTLPVIKDLSDHYVTQYEKDYLEEQGFLKMDFLSLTNLTTIDYCLKLIEQNHNKKLSFYTLPFEDDKIFEILRTCQTAGIFQLESSGMKGAIKILKPYEFNDIVALISLFRPGPMTNIKEYQNRKEGKIKPKYESDAIKKVLESTYGILIYQEQINKLATVMAGFSAENADLFRRAVSHKEKSTLLSVRKDFIEGSIKNGYSKVVAEAKFEEILRFADYGFNKSHAVVYAIIACRMAYLKAYYPLEFYTSLLITSSAANDAKFNEYISELKKRNYKIFTPNVNESIRHFLIKEDGLLFPLSFIKGVSVDTASRIINERMENGEYKDFFDFVKRVRPLKINESIFTALINGGAFDCFKKNRETLRKTLRFAIQYAELLYSDNGQIILDETLEGNKKYFEEESDPKTDLSLEYDALGIMISDNPLSFKKELLNSLKVTPLIDVPESNGQINIVGIVSSVKKIKTRKSGTTMAFLKIYDQDADLEVTIFPKLYETSFQILEKNRVLFVKGKYDTKDDKTTFIADEVSELGD